MWPLWWEWELAIWTHVEERMEDRGFTEVELRRVLDYADDPKELSDSVKDLTKEIGKRKHLEVVGTAEAADIVVEILHRRKERRSESSYENWDRERFETTDWRIVSYRMTAGEFEHQAEVEGKSWRQAAGSLSKEVERWAKENRARLLALPVAGDRGHPYPEDPFGPR